MMGNPNFSEKLVVIFPTCEEEFPAKKATQTSKNSENGLLGVFLLFFVLKNPQNDHMPYPIFLCVTWPDYAYLTTLNVAPPKRVR